MTVDLTGRPRPRDPAAWILQRAVTGRRRVVNTLATSWMIGSLLLALVPVVVIAVYVVSKGAAVMSVGFLTKNLPIVTQFPGGGIAPAIVGTLVITGVAALMAIPLGVLAAVYLNEYGRQNRIAKVIRFMADVMTGVPSIVMGLFVATIWVSAGPALRLFGLRGLARARGAHAADRHPVVRGDAEARPRRPPPGERRAGRAPLAHRRVGRAAGRAPRHRERRHARRRPRRRVRPRRCCSRSA